MDIFKVSRMLDGLLLIVAVVLCGYSVWENNYLEAFFWFIGGLISLWAVVTQPARIAVQYVFQRKASFQGK